MIWHDGNDCAEMTAVYSVYSLFGQQIFWSYSRRTLLMWNCHRHAKTFSKQQQKHAKNDLNLFTVGLKDASMAQLMSFWWHHSCLQTSICLLGGGDLV